jgi:hypothetical protein
LTGAELKTQLKEVNKVNKVNAYDPKEVSNDVVIRKLVAYAQKVGQSDPGLVIDICHSLYVRNLLFWRGVAIARLEGLQVPFQQGQKVVSVGFVSGRNYWEPRISPNEEKEIKQIFYFEGEWYLEFVCVSSDRGDCFYPADRFRLLDAVGADLATS